MKNLMYLDYHVMPEDRPDVIIVYIGDKVYSLTDSKNKRAFSFTSLIRDIAITNDAEILIDMNGFGIALYEKLSQYKELTIKQLTTERIKI